MTQTEFIIVGQGISGSCLARCLQLAGRSFIVIDNAKDNSASAVAAGVINPVTGRRIVKTWMIDELLAFAGPFYEAWQHDLQTTFFSSTPFIDFFPSAQMLLAFRERMDEGSAHLSVPANQEQYRGSFNYDFGFGAIAPCYLVALRTLLPRVKEQLIQSGVLREESFDEQFLKVGKEIEYRDLRAEKIIFCDGIHSLSTRWFKNLPFAFNKGEALLIQTESDAISPAVYKRGISLVPLGSGQFWAGSSYQWNFDNDEPSAPFLESTSRILRAWLRQPFQVTRHLAAIRPATIERRPFVGMHPHHPRIGIFNGMGTKGCSLAPYFANAFVNHLLEGAPVPAEVSIDRFRRVLN